MQQRDILFCSPFPNYWIFLIGAAVRLYWDELRPFLKGWGLLWFAVYVTLSAFLFLSHNGESVEYQRVTPFIASRILALAALIFSTAFTLPNLAKILRGNDLSYGVYLYHMPVVGTLIALGVAPLAWLWIVVLAATFALAALSWRLIEKPARKLRGRMEIWTKVDQASHPTMAAALPRLSSAALPGTVIALGLATAFYWTEATGRDFRGVISDAPFYTLAPSSSGEALGGAKVAWDGGKMVLTTDETTFGNQWRTPEIGEANGGDYLVAVDVSITGGQVGIGILDAPPSGQWIHTIGRLPQGRSLVRVKAPGTFAVVIFNSNGSPANVMARVDQLTVSAIR